MDYITVSGPVNENLVVWRLCIREQKERPQRSKVYAPCAQAERLDDEMHVVLSRLTRDPTRQLNSMRAPLSTATKLLPAMNPSV